MSPGVALLGVLLLLLHVLAGLASLRRGRRRRAHLGHVSIQGRVPVLQVAFSAPRWTAPAPAQVPPA
jgi:hypothetical protein